MKKQTITNWGNFPITEAIVSETDSYEEIRSLVAKEYPLIARGNGRCYGDAALGEYVFSTRKLNKTIAFDCQEGVYECESGVLLSTLLKEVVPKGYFLAVTPGTQYITVGGAIASDVHGKNHHLEGCFSTYILSFLLVDASGVIVRCSRTENTSLFWATIGGMGLTGIILSARIKLKKIETAYISQESIKAKNLDEIFKFFDESTNWTYTVAWIDCLKGGHGLGRSVLLRGEHAGIDELSSGKKKNPLKTGRGTLFSIPFYFPGFMLNPFTMRVFNWFYYHKQIPKKKKSKVHYSSFFYPLDSINNWNRIYGKKGFIQYQLVIPKESANEGIRQIFQTIKMYNQGAFLTVLKLFGKNDPEAYNSFPMEGYTLALDFKMSTRLVSMVKCLDEIVERCNGRIYRAKDSMSKPELIDYLRNIDTEQFISLQQKRVTENRSL